MKHASITEIIIVPLYGQSHSFRSVDAAIQFFKHPELLHDNGPQPFVRFEVSIHYADTTRIEGRFPEVGGVIAFLKHMEGF